MEAVYTRYMVLHAHARATGDAMPALEYYNSAVRPCSRLTRLAGMGPESEPARPRRHESPCRRLLRE
eukprot:gene11833-10234_t